jgi:hypothetical protein
MKGGDKRIKEDKMRSRSHMADILAGERRWGEVFSLPLHMKMLYSEASIISIKETAFV